MKIAKSVATLAIGLVLPIAAHASSICPVLNGGYTSGGGALSSTYTANSSVTNGGCNVLITFGSNGSIATTYPNTASSYDSGGDDNLIGILNNTGSAITSVNLSSTSTDIFFFEGDGACEYTVGGSSPCSSANPNGYSIASITASNISGNYRSGTINFGSGGIAAGGSAWFSLEGPVDVNLQVRPSATPEPSSLLLLGTGALGIAGTLRRRVLSAIR